MGGGNHGCVAEVTKDEESKEMCMGLHSQLRIQERVYEILVSVW